MTDKEYFIDFWTPTVGREEAERSWEVKQSQMRRVAPMVQGDIQPYQSMIDGSMITSRSQHREHLKQHNCIEVGNETKHLKAAEMKAPTGLKQELINQVNAKLRYN